MQLEHNFNKAANFVRSAARQGAELVVLPGEFGDFFYVLLGWIGRSWE